MGTSSKQEELKGFNDVQSSLWSYPVFFPVFFFLYTSTIGTGLTQTTKKMFHNANQLLQPTNPTNGSFNVNWQCTADGDLSREHSEKKGGPGCPSGSLVSCCSQHMAHSLSFSLTAQ